MSEPAPEQPLPGGHINPIVRVGRTVRRPPPGRAGFVRRLLHHLERHRWPAAPRFRGTDETGREILTYIDGYVPREPANRPPSVRSEVALAEVAQLVRQFHDLTAGTELAGDAYLGRRQDARPTGDGCLVTDHIRVDVAYIHPDVAREHASTSVGDICVTRVATLARADAQVRDYLATLYDIDTRDVEIDVVPQRAREIEQARRDAAREARDVARELRKAGLSVSDTAAVLKVSRGRVSQLVS